MKVPAQPDSSTSDPEVSLRSREQSWRAQMVLRPASPSFSSCPVGTVSPEPWLVLAPVKPLLLSIHGKFTCKHSILTACDLHWEVTQLPQDQGTVTALSDNSICREWGRSQLHHNHTLVKQAYSSGSDMATGQGFVDPESAHTIQEADTWAGHRPTPKAPACRGETNKGLHENQGFAASATPPPL